VPGRCHLNWRRETVSGSAPGATRRKQAQIDAKGSNRKRSDEYGGERGIRRKRSAAVGVRSLPSASACFLYRLARRASSVLLLPLAGVFRISPRNVTRNVTRRTNEGTKTRGRSSNDHCVIGDDREQRSQGLLGDLDEYNAVDADLGHVHDVACETLGVGRGDHDGRIVQREHERSSGIAVVR
jgi:hypothetical protein